MSVWELDLGFWCFAPPFFSWCLERVSLQIWSMSFWPNWQATDLQDPSVCSPALRVQACAIATRSKLRSSCGLSTEPSSQSSLRVYFNRMESYYIHLSQARISNPHPVINRKSSVSPSEETFSRMVVWHGELRGRQIIIHLSVFRIVVGGWAGAWLQVFSCCLARKVS